MGIVASYSYMVIVNAITVRVSCFRQDGILMTRTVNLFIFLHELERVIVDVAVEVHIWPWMLNVSETQGRQDSV